MELNVGTITLPTEAATHSFGLLAVRGAGKSNAARVLAEEFFDAGLPFVAIDPVGSWWGLRAGRDGTAKGGLSVAVLGGKHGDLPLHRDAGERIAQLVVKTNLSCVLDLSDMDSEAAKKKFLLDFAKELYRINETARHIFLEEADDYIPQRPQRDELHLKRAWENIVRRGRSRGLGFTLITQRSAVVNKDVLTQVETLFVMRTTGPQDRAALRAWVSHNDTGIAAKELDDVPSLKSGEAFCWSPTLLGRSVRMQFRLSRTFDSGATPKAGETRRAATLADVDLGPLKAELAALGEEDEAPKSDRPARHAEAELHATIDRLGRERNDALQEVARFRAAMREAAASLLATLGQALDAASQPIVAPVAHRDAKPAKPNGAAAERAPTYSPPPVIGIGKGEAAVLTAVAQHRDGVTREQLTVLTGYKRSSRDTYLQKLRSARLVEEDGATLRATDAGRKALGTGWRPLPTGRALREHWLQRLGAGERTILEVLIAAHPRWVTKATIDKATGYKRSSRDTYLQKLRARRLATDSGSDGVKASDELF